MEKQGFVIIADYTDETELSFNEICEICHVPSNVIQHLIQYDVIHPKSTEPEMKFDLAQLQRVQTALRLQHDLEINLIGVALVLDLLDEVKDLREQAAFFEKHYHL